MIEVSDPRRVPAVLSRAFHLARSGRPGPVVVSLPRDMLDETADIPLVEPYPVLRANPEPALIQEMVQRLGAAKSPIIAVAARALSTPGRGRNSLPFLKIPGASGEYVSSPCRISQRSRPLPGESEQCPEPHAMRWPGRISS